MKQIKEQQYTSDFGRVMPQALDFEEAVLSAILIEKYAFETASNIISMDMFYSDANRIIFETCSSLKFERIPIDLLTVSGRLRETGRMEECGGISYFSRLSQIVLSSAHIEAHCLTIKEKYLRRKLIEICLTDASIGYDESEDIVDLIDKINMEIEQLQEIIIGKSNTIHISQAARKSIDDLFIRIDNNKNGMANGIQTGFADLDRITNGWKPEKLIILAARPGIGKTSIAIHIARKAALSGVSVVFFQLEMGATELTDRMIIAESEVNAEEYNSGRIEPLGWSKAESAAGNICRLPIYIEENPKVTVNDIANKARLLKKQGKCEMVIIDYLQLVSPNSKQGRTREQEITEMSRLLKVHAKELKVPFIVLSQMNRAIEGEKREPRLSDLRESGSIEQDGDMVIFINRPEDVRDKSTGEPVENYIELIVKKHRSGKTGRVKLRHNDSMTNFYDYDSKGYSEINPNRSYKNYYEKEESPF